MSFTGKPEGYNFHPFYMQPSKSELTFCYKFLSSLVRVCHKRSSHAKFRLNVGLTKINQNTPAPQTISFHRTLQREKHKHRTPWGLRSPQHHKLRFYSLPHHRNKKSSTPQHRKSPCPPHKWMAYI